MSSIIETELVKAMEGSLERFLSSFRGGSASRASFLQDWISFHDTLQSHRDHLKDETLINAHSLASNISVIASEMLGLDATGDLMGRQLAADISHILNGDMENLVIRDEFPIPPGQDSKSPYIKPCSQWLLANLHNPYPPKSIRNSICRQTGSSIKDLDAWFTDARRRIGWNQLRRSQFSNRREKIVDAATSFFKPSRTFLKIDQPLQAFPSDRSDDHSMAFVELEEHARRLFSDKFEETPLARTIDDVFLDVRPPTQVQDQSKTNHIPSSNSLKRKRRAYPSPERSPEPLSPSITAISTPIFPSAASHKRRRSESPEPCADNIPPDRSQKRSRRPTDPPYSDNTSAAASLPSPPASLHEVSSPSGDDFLLSPSAIHPTLPIVTLPNPRVIQGLTPAQSTLSNKRKRSTSDLEDQRPSKYLQPASLSRITSNPLPISNTLMPRSSVQDLPQGNLHSQSIPNYLPSFSLDPVLDDSAPLQISCFQFPLEDQGDHIHNPMPMPNEFTPALFQGTIDWSSFSGLSTWVDHPQDKSRDVANSEDSFGLNGQDFIELDITNLFRGLPTVDEIYAPTSALFNDWTTVVNQSFHTDAPSLGQLGVRDKASSVELIIRNSTELVAKRERAEFLRAELKRLEADIV